LPTWQAEDVLKYHDAEILCRSKTPDLSRLALCATGSVPNPNDFAARAAAAAQRAIATVRTALEQATKAATEAWRPPTLMSMPVFPTSSVPVYVAVHAKNHRSAMNYPEVPKIASVSRPTFVDDDVRFAIKTMDDAWFVNIVEGHQMEDQVSPEARFYFQPKYNWEAHSLQADKVDTWIYWLYFTPKQIDHVRRHARRLVTNGNSQQAAHIVLVVVKDDEMYKDLSVHASKPLAMHDTDPPSGASMMSLSFDDFVAGAPTKYIHPLLPTRI